MRENNLYDRFREELDFIENNFSEALTPGNASQMGSIQTQIGQLQAQKVKLEQQSQQLDKQIAQLQKQLANLQVQSPSTVGGPA